MHRKQHITCFCRGSMFYIYLYLFTYTGFQTRIQYQMLFISLNSNTTNVTSGEGTGYPSGVHEFTPVFLCEILVAQSLVFCVVFNRSVLCCLLFFNLRLLITPLPSSNFISTSLCCTSTLYVCC